MASRYSGTSRIDGGRGFATNRVSSQIRSAVLDGTLDYTTTIIKQGQRLDIIAGQKYGDSSMWWIIAAASGIGWGLQLPPGTLITIPSSPGHVMRIIG